MGDFLSEGILLFFVQNLILLGLDLGGLDALQEDLQEIEENFDDEVGNDENEQIEEIEEIENLSQNLDEVLSQEANNEVFYPYGFIDFSLF